MKYVLTITLAILGVSCAKMTVKRDTPAVQPHVQYKFHRFLFGIVNHPTTMSQKSLCPDSQIDSIRFIMNPLDVTFTVLTVGLYAPTTALVSCGKATSSPDNKNQKI